MRCTYVCEGNWDTSLHDSKLLNRPTPANEHVFISISVHLELEQCIQPVVINKDICVNIQVFILEGNILACPYIVHSDKH